MANSKCFCWGSMVCNVCKPAVISFYESLKKVPNGK